MPNRSKDRADEGEVGWGESSRLDALEASLRERERELEEAQRIARLGTWRWVRATDTVTWSEEVYRVYGLDPKLPPPGYEAIRDRHAPGSRGNFEAAVLNAIVTGEAYELDVELMMPDGSTRWIIARGEVEAYVDGEVAVLRGTLQDITERKIAEQRIVESQSRFERLYQSDLIGIGYPDAEGGIRDGNDELLRIIGYEREELEAGLVRWDKMTPPEYHQTDREHIAECLEQGSCAPYRKEYIRKNGDRIPVMVGFAELGGTKQESIGFVLDLSAQKKAEDSVREREQRFSALAESLPQMVWEANPDGSRTYANKRYTQYTGVSVEDMAGSKWLELIHDEDRDRTEELWIRCTRSGENYLNEYRIRRHDGAYRTFLVRAVPLRTEAGEIARWLGSATDIHDQKLAEETLRRTEKLAAAGRLAASIAHEINNPLEAVTNALYLALTDTSLSSATRTYLLMAEQELARVAQVATQTLRFHRQSGAPARVDVCAIMDSAFALYGPRLEACGITVSREYEAGQVLLCRADELRQVFSNLLSNSFDATRRGGRLVIRIRSAKMREGVRITIADTGDGIPVEIRKKIFEPFITTKDATGTGLGLWVSDGIVQKHKGRISVRSRTGEGHGTVFCVFFPFDGIEAAGGAGRS